MDFLWPFRKNNKIQTDKLVKIGKRDIIMPFDHMLDNYMQTYPRYDQALGEIARIMYRHLGKFNAIDIGANIGDSAALICKYQNIPVLCIEGCDLFLPYLRKNALKIGPHIKIVNSFVGTNLNFVSIDSLSIHNGTASIIRDNFIKQSNEFKNEININSLDNILLEHETFINSKLLKIDTDGFDFLIIIQSLDYLKKSRPILFFEYDPSYKINNEEVALKVIDDLLEIGYSKFLIYDNFGNFLITLKDKSGFYDLNAFFIFK